MYTDDFRLFDRHVHLSRVSSTEGRMPCSQRGFANQHIVPGLLTVHPDCRSQLFQFQ